MQRVAIARALVGNPDILLADEPTGALDTKTSIQIMNLLKEIAKEKLVIMVTHNPELAMNYSTRIIRLLDGNVIDDSNPYNTFEDNQNETKNGKTNMNFLTALSLSLNNLLTKKGRTILTAFAGSIGIIGIALILSLSNGMQKYIDKVEEDTLSSYPITLQEQTMDTASLLEAASKESYEEIKRKDNEIHSMNITNEMLSLMSYGAKTNNLYEFNKYITNNLKEFNKYMNNIQYSYNLNLNIYKENEDKTYTQVSPDQIIDKMGMSTMSEMSNLFSGGMSNYNAFTEMLDNQDLIKEQYDILTGRLPKSYNEIVITTTKDYRISDYTLYALGLLDSNDLINNYEALLKGEEIPKLEEISYTYDELLNLKFKVLLNTDYYTKNNGVWINEEKNEKFLTKLLDDALELKVVGIIKPKEEMLSNTNTYGGVLYTSDLTKYVIDEINKSKIAQEQLNNPNKNIFTDKEFSKEEFDLNKLKPEEISYLQSLALTNPEMLADIIENYQENATATYESNLEKLGIVDLEHPSIINIYAKDFKSKEALNDLITTYNEKNTEENQISYVDFIAVMMSGASNIINIISYVLMTFVSISLIVSSIMIGIITYISVLERTKEIGILRSIGASKKDISRVFNAETLIVGATAGILGILVTLLLNIPINMIIKSLTDISNISKLPFKGAIILIFISIFLTIIAGLIPAKMASKKDPVEALRTE